MRTEEELRLIARRVAERLDGTADSLEAVLDEDDAADQMPFCRELDRLVFTCQKCGWWHRQLYNATPDAAEWICEECDRERSS